MHQRNGDQYDIFIWYEHKKRDENKAFLGAYHSNPSKLIKSQPSLSAFNACLTDTHCRKYYYYILVIIIMKGKKRDWQTYFQDI